MVKCKYNIENVGLKIRTKDLDGVRWGLGVVQFVLIEPACHTDIAPFSP